MATVSERSIISSLSSGIHENCIGAVLQLMKKACPVNLVVAHTLEAKLLIQVFGLEKLEHDPYPLYKNDSGLALIVAGMGSERTGAAVATLGSRQKDLRNRVRGWLNIGIAGHQHETLGRGLLAHKISDRLSGKSFYPPMLLKEDLSSSDVITVDQPELDYPENAAYEMEAFGFYNAACRYSTSELVQVYKIISDNPFNSVEGVNQKTVSQWFLNNVDNITRLLARLAELVVKTNTQVGLPKEVDEFSSQLHFSRTQKIQLSRLIQRLYALGRADFLEARPPRSFRDAKQFIHALEKHADRVSDSLEQ